MAKKEPSKFAKFLKSVLATVLIVVASVGATLFYYERYGGGIGGLGSLAAAPVEPPPAPLPAPIFTPLEPFTVTLRTETSSRILYVAVTLRVADEESRKVITSYMPEVRDRILRRLSEQRADYVQTPEGRSALVAALTKDVEAPYTPNPRGPVVTGVLFTAFVIQ
ncbi:flagellar basal body-associated FliL family protein [Alcaligenaceae bacterium]|uniref:flagellar basal body-associated FliL family protein n=1 Tax=Parapusillimonas sp. JC17 TaxID=3445768 RepID=UPI0015D30592|nr:flagellar basal body-associated FliL family protein [Alcaligenaceae bacterium]